MNATDHPMTRRTKPVRVTWNAGTESEELATPIDALDRVLELMRSGHMDAEILWAELAPPAYMFKRTPAERIDEICERHFNAAARAAEAEIRPILLEQFANVRAFVPLAVADEGMGQTVLTFDGPWKGASQFDLAKWRSPDDPLYLLPEVLQAVTNFENLLGRVQNYETRWNLFSRITKEDCTHGEPKKENDPAEEE